MQNIKPWGSIFMQVVLYFRSNETCRPLLLTFRRLSGLVTLVAMKYEPAHDKTYNKTCDQRKLRSACASAQSDQSLRWSYVHSTASRLKRGLNDNPCHIGERGVRADLIRERQLVWIPVCVAPIQAPFQKEYVVKRMNPNGNRFFPFRVYPFSESWQSCLHWQSTHLD